MEKKNIIFGFCIFIMIFFCSLASAEWYSSNYTYRREINFTETGRIKEPIILNISTFCPGFCNGDYSDIAITYINETGSQYELDFEFLDTFFEQDPSTADVIYTHFILPNSSNTVYVYYNSSTATAKNGSVFVYYSSFETESGSSNTWSDWSVHNTARLMQIEVNSSGAYRGNNLVKKQSGTNSAACHFFPTDTPYEYWVEGMIYVDPQGLDQSMYVGDSNQGGCESESSNDNEIGAMSTTSNVFYQYLTQFQRPTTQNHSNNTWQSYRNHIRTGVNEGYINDILVLNQTSPVHSPGGIQQVKIGFGHGSGGHAGGRQMLFDEMRIGTSEFRSYSTLNTIGVGDAQMEAGGFEVTSARIINDSFQDYGLSIVEFTDFFYIQANVTDGGESVAGQECNYSVDDINHNFFNYGGNETLIGGNSVDLESDHESLGVYNDIVVFRVCHESTQSRPVEYYINNLIVPFDIIPAIQIPSCSTGFHEEVAQTSLYTGSDSLNVSVECSGCNIGQPMRVIGNIDTGTNIALVRQHQNFTDEMDYNTTTKYYEDIDALHSLTYGAKTINISCNQSTAEYLLNLTVLSIVPTVVFNEITVDDTIYDYTTNGTTVEAGKNITILGDCSGVIINITEMNITYENGTLIKTVADEVMSLNSSDLNVAGVYNTTLLCTNNGDAGLSSQSFTYQDTLDPTITWYTPTNANTTSIEENSTLSLRVDFSDPNLFGYNCTLTDPNSNKRYNYTRTDITGNYYTLQENIVPDVVGTWIMYCRVTDDHTKNKIKTYDYKVKDKDLTFTFDKIINKQITASNNVSIKYVSGGIVDDLVVNKQKDRYTFNYKLKKGSLLKTIKGARHEFKVYCDDIVYREKSQYPGHFVCPKSENWIDFQTPHLKNYKADCHKGYCDLTLYMDEVEDFTFQSIGGINQANETVTFQVTEQTNFLEVDLFECPNTVQGQIMLFALTFFLLGIYVVGLIFAPILSFLSGLAMLFMSTTWYTCQAYGGIFLAMIAFMMITVAIMKGFFKQYH